MPTIRFRDPAIQQLITRAREADKISSTEVNEILAQAKADPAVTDEERQSLERLLSRGDYFQDSAGRNTLRAFLESNPVDVADRGDPEFRDASIRSASSALNLQSFSKADVDKLIEGAKDGSGISFTEAEDLGRLLVRHGDRLAPDAKATIESVLGLSAVTSTGTPPPTRDPLEGIPFVNAATWANNPVANSARDSAEIESVRAMSGLSTAETLALARNDIDGRPGIERMRRAKEAEAFTLGYSGGGVNITFDNMQWSSDAHRIRESIPYMGLVVEGGRIAADAESGELEVTQGTDLNADTYYKMVDPNRPGHDAFIDNDISIRTRVRHDQPGVPTRILMASKIGGSVDENGLKSAAKRDVRDDSPTSEEIAHMDTATRTGVASMGSWSRGGVEHIKEAYDLLKSRDALPDVGSHQDVMILEPGVNIFSQRSRYHLNETSPANIKLMLDAATENTRFGGNFIEDVKQNILASTTLPQPEKDRLLAMADGLTSKNAILEKAREGLAALTPGTNPADITVDTINALWPRAVNWGARPSKEDTLKREVVANAIKGAYDEFSTAFDDVRREIAGSRDQDARALAFNHDDFSDFCKTKFPELKSVETAKPFLTKLDEILAGPAPERDAFVAEFATWLAAPRPSPDPNSPPRDPISLQLQNATDKVAMMGSLRKLLVNEHLDVLHRQVEASGTAAKQLWFDEARQSFANINRQSWNFLIDTFDFVQAVDPKVWEQLTPEQRDGREQIPADKIFHAEIVAEVQIELGYEAPYLTALSEAKKAALPAAAGLFMDFALADGTLGANLNDPASFTAIVGMVTRMNDDDRARFIERVNAHSQSKGSSLVVDEALLKLMDANAFVASNAAQPTTNHAALQKDLEMTNFMWKTVTSAQEHIADLRGNRVRSVAREVGHRVGWEPTEMAKGERAMRVLNGTMPN